MKDKTEYAIELFEELIDMVQRDLGTFKRFPTTPEKYASNILAELKDNLKLLKEEAEAYESQIN